MKRIPPYKLLLEPLNEEARQAQGYEWAGGEIGKRHRIGGDPDFIQEDEIPICPECRIRMTFYAQLDGVGDEYDIADCAMIFVFLCFDCFTVTAFVQSA